MPKLPTKVCVACGDTGRDSRGAPCHPCLAHGRIKPEQRRAATVASFVSEPEPPAKLPERIEKPKARVEV